MKEINLKFDLSRARNAEHYQFHSDMLAIFTSAFASAQGIADQRSAYQSAFDVENDCYLQNRSMQDTPAVEAADKLRDDFFRYTAQTIATGKLCPVQSKREAAGLLDYVIDPYRNAATLNYASNTAAVSDFVQKIKLPQYTEAVSALGLTEAIQALDDANTAFNDLYTGRSSENLSRATSETMKTARPKTDVVYRELASAVNALYQVNALVTKDSAKEQTLAATIDRANAVILQLQQTLSKAGVGAKPNFKPGDDKPDGEKESDGDKPTEL